MLDPSALGLATHYWARHFGCAPEEFLSESVRIVTHGPELADYAGVFALFRPDAVIISLPPDRAAPLRALFPSQLRTLLPETLAFVLAPVAARVIGPADIAYATRIAPPAHSPRALGPEDATALHALQQACPPLDWKHGGSADEHPCSGVFVDRRLTALAGYEVWGGAIAHIAVVTHPDFRRRGYGQSAVAHLAQRAILAGLLPQYRTLEANAPSICLARNLGFQSFARSLAIRLRPQA